jgi:cytochrome P450
MQRMALGDYTFKDGLSIPAGTSIVMPSRLLGLDPDLHSDPDRFDAERWKRIRKQGDATKFHFASLQDDMLPWGSGPHACPGRFLAQEILKLIFIHFVTKYDIKFPEGDGHRPPDLSDHGVSNPNMMAMLLFKER